MGLKGGLGPDSIEKASSSTLQDGVETREVSEKDTAWSLGLRPEEEQSQMI